MSATEGAEKRVSEAMVIVCCDPLAAQERFADVDRLACWLIDWTLRSGGKPSIRGNKPPGQADGVGFEPTVPVRVRRFSRPVP